MLNYTRIPAPRVTLVDPQTGIVANEWFRFFNNLYSIAYAATGSVTAGTYGSATAVPQITVDDFGGITAVTNVPIAIDASQIVSGTIASARISGSYTGITGVGTLTVGTWNASTITTPYGGTGLTSYTAGDTLYYASGSALAKLTIGASTYINTSSGTAPQWTDPSTITIGKATNLVGGAANRIAYQTATDTTGFIVAPTVSNTYLEWSGTAFQWSSNPLGTVTSVSVVSANGLAGTVATATTTPAITLSTTVTGLLKGNGTAISAASSGTDYAPATSGTSILYGNGAGGFSNVTIGTGVSFAGGTLSATGSGGTVTSVSGTGSVNGITLTGTVTSSGSLTLGGTLSGIGNSQLTNSTISGVALGGNLFDLTAGTGVTFSTGTTYNGSAAITINATGTGGTVTSVAATVPSFLSISGSPITTSGTLAITLSGTALPVANGGTGSTTAFTAGSVVFAGASGVYSQKNANFFWDNTNNRLGIGTATPVKTFSVSNADQNQARIRLENTSGRIYDIVSGVSGLLQSGFSIFDATASATVFTIFASGGVSIGNTTDPGATNLSVTGFASAASFRPTSATIPTNGMYLPAANAVGFATNSTRAVYIDSSQNVGIGISGPLEILSIYKDAAATIGIRVENPRTVANGGVKLELSRGGAQRPAYIRYQTLTTDEWFVGELANGGVANTVYSISTTASLSGSKLAVFPSGGVSIGNTTDPGATNLSVTGTIVSASNIYSSATSSTSMTNGFIYIPAAAGAPSGVPTAVTGKVAMYYDSTNNNFYVYNGAWKKILLA